MRKLSGLKGDIVKLGWPVNYILPKFRWRDGCRPN